MEDKQAIRNVISRGDNFEAECKALRTENKRLREIADSVRNYRTSELFAEWQEYIKNTSTGEQVDFFVYQAFAAATAMGMATLENLLQAKQALNPEVTDG